LSAAAAMPRDLTESDRDAWASFTRPIEPLRGRIERASPASATSAPALTTVASAARRREALPGVAIGAHPPGVDGSTWRRFQSGRLGVQRRLDLHGRTALRAYQALVAFLHAAQADQLRCVEVITGRGTAGGGVLRRELPLWLNLPELRPLILAAAHPHAANPGAVRLLLRRMR
jgi:DNA-nicking Smr family endonuclease